MSEGVQGENRKRTVDKNREAEALHVEIRGPAHLPSVDVKRGEVVKMEPKKGREIVGGLSPGDHVPIGGKVTVRHPSNGERPEVVEELYLVPPWVQNLILALVAAIVMLAAEAAFGWVGKLLALLWKVIVRIAAHLGVGG